MYASGRLALNLLGCFICSVQASYLSFSNAKQRKIVRKIEKVWITLEYISRKWIWELNISSIGHSAIIYYVLFSIPFFAKCDANYCATLDDLEQFQNNNNSAALASSQMGETFDNESINSFVTESLS